jgi:hypothetical protein
VPEIRDKVQIPPYVSLSSNAGGALCHAGRCEQSQRISFTMDNNS